MKRRTFHKTASPTGLAVAATPNLLLGAAKESPNEKLNMGIIGSGGRGSANLRGVASENIVALCDVNVQTLEAVHKKYPKAKKYTDWRKMMDDKSIDAVTVSTADHCHAPASVAAMRAGKHVYCEKPLTRDVHEARLVTETARKAGVATQQGTQIHAGNNYRRVVERIQSGAIGTIHRVHVWVNIGHSYSNGVFTTQTPKPAHLDWDLWLGPAVERPYTEGAHTFNWRQFWDYGNGRLGDFGCHYMDLVHWALNLRHPSRVHAKGPELDPISTPPWLEVDYPYSRPGQEPLHLTWHGNRIPEIVQSLRTAAGEPMPFNSGQCFIGSKGILVSDYGKHLLLPEDTFKDIPAPDPFIENSIGHHKEWTEAIKQGGKTTCHFDYGAALTEAVLLGSVSYRSGEAIDYMACLLYTSPSPRDS